MLLIADAPTVEAQDDTLTERRRGLRIRQNRPIKIFDPGIARYYGGQTEDISSAGLRIELPAFTPIRPGKVLNVHVGSSAGEALTNHRHMLPARVIWIDRGPNIPRGRLLAGVEFLGRAAAVVDAA
jgi:hypothetical protein